MSVREELDRTSREQTYVREASVEPRDRIHTGGVVMSIGFVIAALVVFNVFPQWVGVVVSGDDPSTFVPLLTPAFLSYLPLVNAWWMLALALGFMHLGFGRWTVGTRWLDLGLSAFGVFVLWRLIHGGPIVAYNPEATRTLEPLVRLFPVTVEPLAGAVQALLWLGLALAGLGTLRKLFANLLR